MTTCDGDCNEDLTVVDGFGTIGRTPMVLDTMKHPTLCTTDMDGDGYSGTGSFGCYDLVLEDSHWGDGWNGNALVFYEDGVPTISATLTTGTYGTGQYCPDPATQVLDVYFVTGSFNSEISVEMFDETGALVLSGQGTGSFDIIVNGVTYTDGDIVYTGLRSSDCDDLDDTVGAIDADGDGAVDCQNDCDPTDPTLNADDLDGDGTPPVMVCDDNDASLIQVKLKFHTTGSTRVALASTILIKMVMETTSADGIVMETVLTRPAVTWMVMASMILLPAAIYDNNPDINSLAEEICDGLDNDCDTFTDEQDPDMDPANLNTYYEDLDGDGYGNDAVTLGACSPTGFFVEESGDCNDDPNTNGQAFNPGMPDAPYDGVDTNCDGLNDFDADGDGEVAAEIDVVVFLQPLVMSMAMVSMTS